MFGTDEGWPSRLLPTPKQSLKVFALSIALVIVAGLVGKARSFTSTPVSASVKPMVKVHLPKAPASFGGSLIINPMIVFLGGLYVHN